MVEIGYGWLGFVYTDESFLSDGIVKVTDDNYKNKDFIPSHVFILLNNGMILEALAFKGIQFSHISKYLSNNNCIVRFKNPKFPITDLEKSREATCILSNYKYDFRLILGLFISNTIGKFLFKKWTKKILQLLDNDDKYICSELAIKWSFLSGSFQEEETDRKSPVDLYYTSPNLDHLSE